MIYNKIFWFILALVFNISFILFAKYYTINKDIKMFIFGLITCIVSFLVLIPLFSITNFITIFLLFKIGTIILGSVADIILFNNTINKNVIIAVILSIIAIGFLYKNKKPI